MSAPSGAVAGSGTGPGRRWLVDAGAMVAFLIVVNGVVASLVDGWAEVAVLVGAAVLAVYAALRRGYSTGELGLAADDVGAGIRLGGPVALLVLAGVVVAALVPATREFFDDDRFVDIGAGEVFVEAALRIPLVTALGEELLFRSVLLAILLAGLGPWRAVLGSSLVFGLWHVLTTIGDLDGNEVSADFSAWEASLGVVVVVLVTGGAGVLFAWLRLRSNSVVAPWLVHTAFNTSAYVTGAVVVTGGHV
ncbi:MAG: CPBP family intramembrane glutamic endopeptidase [Acidimicrobiales bacterium]